ncbi:Histone-lysine N-methyltransferase [Zostera marina]|uniref:Histone-lysine N-methyltransferase n=1 Tax=Zostera marina TaxID=29655 RepID=A0A0K9PE12_ZOSMR|nr:Histone-lysine N-methyltransferase [Zostera marina]
MPKAKRRRIVTTSTEDGGHSEDDDHETKLPESVVIGNAFAKLLSLKNEVTNFELPEYLKKLKFTHYVPIKRNMYLTKRRIEDDGIFCKCSSSSEKTTICDGDCLCGVLFSSCSSSCNCGESCTNKPFQCRPMKKLKLVTTKNCGMGLITDEAINKGDFVIEYVGEVIDDKTCEERLWKMKHRGDTNFYLCEVNHDMVIDATYKGNKSRFINHSCDPNTEMQKWTIEGETRIGIFATRDVEKGGTLTYDYQFVQFGADQDCHCGSICCRKKLGSKLCKLKEETTMASHEDLANGRPVIGLLKENYLRNCIDVMVRVWHPHKKRYIGGIITAFDRCIGKYTILFEDECIEKVDLLKQDWAFL